MNTQFNGLLVCNIELTNICNKSCHCCGRRRLERDYPQLANFTKNMSLDLVYKILDQLPSDIVIQWHGSGDPLCYPHLKEALSYRKDIIRCYNTNGKLLIEKANEIIDNMETLTISVIENDPEKDEQFEIVKQFLEIKSNRSPYIIFRLLGDIGKREIYIGFESDKTELELLLEYKNRIDRWYSLAKKYNCLVVTRILHDPMGSFNYKKKVTIPEIGVCLDLLSHLVIDVDGNVSICVRFDPNKYGVIGNINNESLIDIWNSEKRKYYIQEHIKGHRNCNQLCNKCDFYGVPRGE